MPTSAARDNACPCRGLLLAIPWHFYPPNKHEVEYRRQLRCAAMRYDVGRSARHCLLIVFTDLIKATDPCSPPIELAYLHFAGVTGACFTHFVLNHMATGVLSFGTPLPFPNPAEETDRRFDKRNMRCEERHRCHCALVVSV